MNIPSVRLDLLYKAHSDAYETKALEILRSGAYILSEEVAAFENEFALFHGAKHCVGVACGLDALWIALQAMDIGPGDEVIVQGNTFIATFIAVSKVGALPVAADVKDDFRIDVEDVRRKITGRTKAVIVTQLYGDIADMDEVLSLCKEYDLRLMEDAAQAHGATRFGKKAGTFGDAGCFSFYPTKNLGGFGDGGAIITDDKHLEEKMRIIRNYGNIRRNEAILIGKNSRLDALQAGLLRVRLKYLDEINADKRRIAAFYSDHIKNALVKTPAIPEGNVPVWHQYVIQCKERDALKNFLFEKGIGTDIHYPIPPHLTKAYEHLGLKPGDLPVTERLAKEILSLPVWFGISEEELKYITDAINDFHG